MKCYIDVESCGFHGMPVTIQYAFDDGPIEIHEFWTSPIQDSIDLLDKLAQCEVIGYNLAFDWFMINKMYTILLLARDTFGEWEYLDEHIDQVALLEERARDGPCFKPKAAFDIMLHARKTEFQMTMERSDIRIRRVPTKLAYSLAKELEKRIFFESILFARAKDKLAPRFKVHPITKQNGQIETEFKDIVLKFKASSALKNLAIHVLQIPLEEVIFFSDVEVEKAFYPEEYGYAPYALAVGRPGRWKKAWPEVIEKHISHWRHNDSAREYARKDVEYTRRLYHYFNDPTPGDDDSELACMVGCVRWRGYAIDLPGIEALKAEAIKKLGKYPTAPRKVKKFIDEALSPEERLSNESMNGNKTGKIILQKIAEWDNIPCQFGPCDLCNNTGKLSHPACERAKGVLETRFAKKEIELYDKLILAGRFHANFNVIGALSGRMSGTGGLNAQGIKKTDEVRSKFPLAFGGLKLVGGDFSGFEVVLADATYNDPLLRRDLLTCSKCRNVEVIYNEGKKKCPKCGGSKTMKIHALFGVHVYPHMTYDDIVATDGSPGGVDDKYTKCKSAVFAMLYGGEGYTLQTRLGVEREIADAAYQRFAEQYKGVGKARNKVIDSFCSMRQTGGIGSRIIWNDPAEYVESLFGFRRYFNLENRIVKALFELAEKPPKAWKELKIKVVRRDREQTAVGALQSALFAAAFQVQAGNCRAAANHQIQSSGAEITKRMQRRIWDLQPHGCHEWLTQPLNAHDQVLTPSKPELIPKIAAVVHEVVESFRARIPLIEIDWSEQNSWGKK
jgi:hypothetical protein